MRTVLITGAGGYIGSVATSMLLARGYRVIAIDNFGTGFEGPLKLLARTYGADHVLIHKLSLSDDLSDILKQHGPIDAVLHYAAHCSVNESMRDPHKYFENNVSATECFINQIVQAGIKHIVFSSTCAVYGEAEKVPIEVSHPTRPANPYGESKLMAEKIITWYASQRGLRYMILRYFNVCGATDDGLIGDSKKPSVHLMQNAVRGALGIEPFYLTCGTFDTPDGTPIRDYVNVVDLNTAHLLALDHLFAGKSSEIINLGTGNGNSVLEIVRAVQEVTGYAYDLKKSTARAGEYPIMIADTRKASEVLGWKPVHRLVDSVESLVKWYRSKPHGWER